MFKAILGVLLLRHNLLRRSDMSADEDKHAAPPEPDFNIAENL